MTKKAKLRAVPNGQEVTKEFTFPLSIEQLAKRGEEMAKLSGETADLRAEQKNFNAVINAKINARLELTEKIAKTIRAKSETRLEPAIMVKQYESNLVQYFFDGKLIEERAMTAEEHQVHMDDINPKKKPKVKNGRDPRKALKEEKTEDQEMASVIKQETSRKTKRSAVDGVWNA